VRQEAVGAPRGPKHVRGARGAQSHRAAVVGCRARDARLDLDGGRRARRGARRHRAALVVELAEQAVERDRGQVRAEVAVEKRERVRLEREDQRPAHVRGALEHRRVEVLGLLDFGRNEPARRHRHARVEAAAADELHQRVARVDAQTAERGEHLHALVGVDSLVRAALRQLNREELAYE
jgi:hypothetical protein